MKSLYSERIAAFCAANGVLIPSGFHRHPASRYAIIQLNCEPLKLVARTWFNMADVIYYIEHLAAPDCSPDEVGTAVRILDFKEGVELRYTGGKRLERGDSFI